VSQKKGKLGLLLCRIEEKNDNRHLLPLSDHTVNSELISHWKNKIFRKGPDWQSHKHVNDYDDYDRSPS